MARFSLGLWFSTGKTPAHLPSNRQHAIPATTPGTDASSQCARGCLSEDNPKRWNGPRVGLSEAGWDRMAGPHKTSRAKVLAWFPKGLQWLAVTSPGYTGLLTGRRPQRCAQ
jgi:hypothetical protein